MKYPNYHYFERFMSRLTPAVLGKIFGWKYQLPRTQLLAELVFDIICDALVHIIFNVGHSSVYIFVCQSVSVLRFVWKTTFDGIQTLMEDNL